jgi:hypothetical protein
MKTYLFTVPLLAGKTEAWKNYVKEMNGPRNEEYKLSRKKAGIKVEQVFLQQTPHGDMCVVMLGGDNPQKALDTFKTSTDPFDKWFREKIMIETHGMDLSQPMPQNNHLIDFNETTIRELADTKKHG